jgi:hypothetical protein
VQASLLCDAAYLDLLNVDQLGVLYNDVLTNTLDQMIPFRSATIRRRPPDPWFDDVCHEEKRQARRMERKFKSSKTDDERVMNRVLWTDQLQKYRHTLTSQRSSFWSNEINTLRSSPKKLWKTIDKLLGRGHTQADKSISADKFNDFFETKVVDVRLLTANAGEPVFTSTTHRLPSFLSLSVDDVLKVIRCLPDKQSHLDPMPTWLLKETAETIAPFITKLVNLSLSSGIVPSIFKRASIIPLLKKSGLDASDTKNYRPISNLSVLSKLLERVVAQQLVTYLNTNNLFPDRQSAYRKYHSTETALAQVLSDIFSAIDSGNLALLSMLDMSAAFDTVDHQILLRRLSTSFGMSSTVLGWLTSYLSNRRQCVRHNGLISTIAMCTCGVPQGSVLGPILFLLYTADISGLINSFGLLNHSYADDTQVYGFCHPVTGEVQRLRDNSASCIHHIEFLSVLHHSPVDKSPFLCRSWW